MEPIIVFIAASPERPDLRERFSVRSGFHADFMIWLYIDPLTARHRFSMLMEVRFEGLETLSPGIAPSLDQP
jgi:hypothetical protein